jgi:tagatose 1,6-diphosphate aldolase
MDIIGRNHMRNLTIGKFRGIQNCASKSGTITCLALDHRQNLKKSLNPANPDSTTNKELKEFKLKICNYMSGVSTAVLLDPEYSAAQAIASNVIDKGVGLIVALEATGYIGLPNSRKSKVLSGWSVEKAKLMGADGIKLLVYYNPYSETETFIKDLVKETADYCEKFDIIFMLEPLCYFLPTNPDASKNNRKDIVIETVRQLTPLGADILKVEFPLENDNSDKDLWIEAFLEINKASQIPWLLLSSGVSYDMYLERLKIACQTGASGAAVGRAVWKEALILDDKEKINFFNDVGLHRLDVIRDTCETYGKSIYEFYDAKVDFSWYKNYK